MASHFQNVTTPIFKPIFLTFGIYEHQINIQHLLFNLTNIVDQKKTLLHQIKFKKQMIKICHVLFLCRIVLPSVSELPNPN